MEPFDSSGMVHFPVCGGIVFGAGRLKIPQRCCFGAQSQRLGQTFCQPWLPRSWLTDTAVAPGEADGDGQALCCVE